MATVTKPMALDETLQGTNNTISTQNSKLDTMNTKLQAIVDAIGSSSLIGDTDISQIADGTITGAIAGLDSGKVDKTSLGANNGVAQLDSTGKVPSSQLPSFVDDVLEYASVSAFPATGESGKIYVALDTNKTYRWGGTSYVVISETLALGETQDTAYRGDRGKIAYDHSQDANRVTTATAVGLYKVGATSEGHISGLTPIQKSDLTGLGLVGSVTDSTTNGNIVVDGVEIQAYDDTDVQNDIDAIEDELSTDTKTKEGNPINFSTKSAQNAESTIIDLEPIQDLHGYSKPWVGGAGKNKCMPRVTSDTTVNGIKVNVQKDSDGNIIGYSIPTNSATGGNAIIVLGEFTPSSNGDYIFSGCLISGTPSSAVRSFIWDETISGIVVSPITTDSVSVSLTANHQYLLAVYVNDGYTIQSSELKPMIRLASDTDSSFAPYENLCPITGRTQIGILGCGKNLIDTNSATQGKDINSSGEIVNASDTHYVTDYIPVIETKTLHQNRIGNWAAIGNAFYDKNKNFLSFISGEYLTSHNLNFTVPENAKYVRCTITDPINTMQLEYGTSETSYTAYQESNDLTIDLGQTVYGARHDVENGALVVDMGIIDLGDYNYNWQTDNNRFVSTTQISNMKLPIDVYTPFNGVCSSFLVSNTDNVTGSYKGENIAIGVSDTLLRIQTKTTSDTTEFKTLVTGQKLVYELATPTVINLEPHIIKLLKGVNNISVDDAGATITLTYRDGSVATLADLTSAVDNLDSKIDESKILTDTATGDKYILVVTNGTLSIEQISN